MRSQLRMRLSELRRRVSLLHPIQSLGLLPQRLLECVLSQLMAPLHSPALPPRLLSWLPCCGSKEWERVAVGLESRKGEVGRGV